MENSLWRIQPPSSQRKLAEWDDNEMDLEPITCPTNATHQHGGKRLTDLSVVLQDGELADFVWTWYGECLLQDRTLGLLRSNGFTGFEVKPVKARFKTSTECPPKLWELVLTGWAGIAKPESGIRLDESKSCPVCGHLHYTGLLNPRHLIDENKWDGSDIFMVWPMPKYIFITWQVRHTLGEHKLKGLRLTRVSELEPTDGFSPGRLSFWMPEARARELGEPLKIF